MTEKKAEKKFLEDVSNVLDNDIENLDASTRSRLNRARQVALDGAPERERTFFRPVLQWAGTAAAVVMLCGVMYFNVYRPPVEIALDPSMEDLEILADVDDLEFYSQLDFYTWLMEVENDAV